MELGLSQHQSLKQIQTLSPQMYMSMEILCLNTLDLEDKIETEVEDNVALELEAPKDSNSTDTVDGKPASAWKRFWEFPLNGLQF